MLQKTHFRFFADISQVSESNQEHGYYSTLKKRCLLAALYRPMLTLDLEGIYSDTLISGLQWFNCTGGISKATLMPVGYCSCGNVEVNESTAPYLKLGSYKSQLKAVYFANYGIQVRRPIFTNWTRCLMRMLLRTKEASECTTLHGITT